jgi:hypothetical protein
VHDETTDQDLAAPVRFPRLLADDASPEDIVKAVNGLAVEQQLTREAVRALGTTIEMAVRRLDLRGGK